ncbi:hypothetical protein BDV40DRAFT_306881 [Aspergillus tamarii]|uniref:Uncharacterized protein n=1 Tax=Aspergillus tamarii TaxID=41984 RepID=A0A5N6UAE7_ASPTM|nr:hypothetical protein BDV40DRAFT_306881 [Aspergillus tamarii]
MTCFSDISLQAILPPWLGWFCFSRRSTVGLMNCDNGRQDDSQSRDSAVGHDEPQSHSSEYQTPRPLSYEKKQPNLPAPVKRQNPPSILNIQRIKPASPTDLQEEAITAIPETLRKDQANGTKDTSTSRDSGEIIGLPESGLPKPKQVWCVFTMLDDSTKDQIKPLLYVGVIYHPLQEAIMLLGVKHREKTEIMGCSVSFFNGEDQDALRQILSPYIPKDEWPYIHAKYGFKSHV